MTSRPSTAAPILAVLAIGLVTLGAYVGGYLWLGEYNDQLNVGIVRFYPFAWQASTFVPAAKVETFLRHSEVRPAFLQGNAEVVLP
jgi:hypothetical protein